MNFNGQPLNTTNRFPVKSLNTTGLLNNPLQSLRSQASNRPISARESTRVLKEAARQELQESLMENLSKRNNSHNMSQASKRNLKNAPAKNAQV